MIPDKSAGGRPRTEKPAAPTLLYRAHKQTVLSGRRGAAGGAVLTPPHPHVGWTSFPCLAVHNSTPTACFAGLEAFMACRKRRPKRRRGDRLRSAGP